MRPVPEYDAKHWLLKALRETAHAMESLIWNVDDGTLDLPPTNDDWSIRDLVLHMAEMERRQVERLHNMVQHKEPKIAAFDADSIEPSSSMEDCDAFDAMEEFSSQRQQSVYLLWSLDEGYWERRGVHPYLGPITILQVAREMNEHDLAHLWQLRRLCDCLETASASSS
jgi:hypothetical protein